MTSILFARLFFFMNYFLELSLHIFLCSNKNNCDSGMAVLSQVKLFQWLLIVCILNEMLWISFEWAHKFSLALILQL